MVPRRSPNVTYEIVDGRAILIDPDGRELLTLNGVGTIVWGCLDGRRDEAALVSELADRFPEVDRATLADDVAAFLRQLEGSALIVDGAG